MPDFSPAGSLQRTVLDPRGGLFNLLAVRDAPEGFVSDIEGFMPDIAGRLMPYPGAHASAGVAALTPRIVAINYLGGTQYAFIHNTGAAFNTYRGQIGGGGTIIDTGVGVATSADLAVSAVGNGQMIWGAPSFTVPRFITPITFAVGTVGGSVPQKINAVEFHKERFYMAALQDSAAVLHPGRLYYSEIGGSILAAAWPGNFIDINADDGGSILALVSSPDGLYVGKETGIWLLTGSGTSDFQTTKLLGPGLTPTTANRVSRQMVGTPYGIVVKNGMSFWLYNGAVAENFGRPVEWGDVTDIENRDHDSMVFWNGRLYVKLGGGTFTGQGPFYAYDFETKAWSKGWNNDLTPITLWTRPGDAGELIMGRLGTVAAQPLYYYVNSQPLATDYKPSDSGVAATTTYAVEFPFAPGGATRRCTLRHIDILGIFTAGDVFTLTPDVDGTSPAALTAVATARRVRINCALTGYLMKLKLSVTQNAGTTQAPFIREVAALWEWEGAEEGNA